MVLPAIFVVNAIAGTAIRFAAKKAAQSFIKKYGGKIVSNAGKRKVLSSTASGVKRFMDKFKSTKGGQKDLTKGLKKEDMIALTTKKKPSGGKLTTTTKKSNVKPPVSKPKGTSVGSARLKRLQDKTGSRPMKNITPKKGSGTSAVPRGGRTGTRTNPRAGGNLRKTVLALLQNKDANINQKALGDISPPEIGIKPKVTVKRKPEVPMSKPKMADVPKSKPKKKNVPVATKKRRTSPISKPDLSGLTGKFGVKGFSRTGSTMTDFLIGFTDGKGGKGRNYDKFMAKDKNGQYKVKTETLKSMGKRLKEKMKKKK
jgi:hypothetical protein